LITPPSSKLTISLLARVPRPNSNYHQIPQTKLPHQAQHQGPVVNLLLDPLLRNKDLSEEAILRVEEVVTTAREGVSRCET
jgi:hypothetical protein